MNKIIMAFLSILFFSITAFTAPVADKRDSGKFILTVKDSKIGEDTFSFYANGGSTATIKIDIASTHQLTKLNVSYRESHPILVIVDSGKKERKVIYVISGKESYVSVGGKHTTITPPAKFSVTENFAPHLLSSYIELYDEKKGGAQAIDTLLVDGAAFIKPTLTKGTTEVKENNGKQINITNWVLTLTSGTDLNFISDEKNRILYWYVPSQKYSAIRVGYESIAGAELPTNSKLSKPTYTVQVDNKVMSPMRDGVKLACTIWHPKEPGKYPVILERTPYGRETGILEGGYYAKRGYVFISQDVRGKFDSEGKWEPFVNEKKDGYDTIEWAAAQPWSNGNVGMIGASYVGWVQWWAASQKPPHLKTIVPQVSPPDPFFNIPYNFGTFFLAGSVWWANVVDGKKANLPSAKDDDPAKSAKQAKAASKILMYHPMTKLDKKLIGHTIPFFQKWLKHPNYDSYWQNISFSQDYKNIDIPVFHVSGWFDGDGIGTKLNYSAMASWNKQNQFLVYGPWPHAFNSVTKLGELKFGPKAMIDLDSQFLKWFDHWLKDIPNDVEKDTPVQAFLMGANQWKEFSAWPPKEADLTKLYFSSTGNANGNVGKGKLIFNLPTNEKPDKYDFDPKNPWDHSTLAGPQPVNIAKLSKRSDVLIFETPKLVSNVDVMGPISVKLFAATSAKDTDWFARLSDVYPDGRVIRMCEGIIRARFHSSWSKPEMLKPNEIIPYDIDLWAIGNRFKEGHKIRVEISSSNFPMCDVNLNTGENYATSTRSVVAHQKIYHDAAHASYILLPILR